MAQNQLNLSHLVEGDYLNVWQCNNCGAHADTAEEVEHHDTCVAGEAQKWEDHYEDKENQYFDTRW